MNDQERLLFLEAVIEAQQSIIERYAALVQQLAKTQQPSVITKGSNSNA